MAGSRGSCNPATKGDAAADGPEVAAADVGTGAAVAGVLGEWERKVRPAQSIRCTVADRHWRPSGTDL